MSDFERLTIASEVFEGITLKGLCESCGESGCNEFCDDLQDKGCTGCPVQEAFVCLARYEDTKLTPEEIKHLKAERDKAIEDINDTQPCFACAGFERNGGKCLGGGTCRVRDYAKHEGLTYIDYAQGETWRWRGSEV